ncbi:DJ-1/PfpI family protein [Patescibacteria group bacterium AH-259-L05]|nr:DJ-1/PfpI family protein [Patescibacteria group bacterium AH-259-L05]
MNSKFLSVILLVIVSVVLSGCVKTDAQDVNFETIMSQRKAVIIIAQEGFQDVEYSKTREVLEKNDIVISVASAGGGTAVGKFGGEVEVDITLDEVNVSDFDAIIFIGGPGARDYMENARAHELAKATLDQGKLLGAICIASTILAHAGVLQGKKATVWSDPLDKSGIEILSNKGATYVDQSVVVDGNIITANGPASASSFGKKIAQVLNKNRSSLRSEEP